MEKTRVRGTWQDVVYPTVVWDLSGERLLLAAAPHGAENIVYVEDHAWSYLPPSQLASTKDVQGNGYTGRIGYNSYDTTGKNFEAPQIKESLDAGYQIGLVWETQGQRAAQSGSAGGFADGTEHLRQATSKGATGGNLGVNLEDPNPAPQSEWSNIFSYTEAMLGVLEPNGFGLTGYGSDLLLTECLKRGLISKKWAVETWPRGDWSPDLIQMANSSPLSTFGGDIDCNICVPDWGQTLFFGAEDNVQLDWKDPIVAQLVNGISGIAETLGAKHGLDPNGNPLPLEWEEAYDFTRIENIEKDVEAIKTQLATLMAQISNLPISSGTQVDINALANALIPQLVQHLTIALSTR